MPGLLFPNLGGSGGGGGRNGTDGVDGASGGILLRYDDLPDTSVQQAGWIPIFSRTITSGRQSETNGFIRGSIGDIDALNYVNRDGNNVELMEIHHDANGTGNGFVTLELEVDDDRILENVAPISALRAARPTITVRFVAVIGGTEIPLLADAGELDGSINNLEGKIWHFRTHGGVDIGNPFPEVGEDVSFNLYLVSETEADAAALTEIVPATDTTEAINRNWYDFFEPSIPDGFVETVAPPDVTGRLWQALATSEDGVRSGRWSIAPLTGLAGERGEGGGQVNYRQISIPSVSWRRETGEGGPHDYGVDTALQLPGTDGVRRGRLAFPITTGANEEDFVEIPQVFENSDLQCDVSIKLNIPGDLNSAGLYTLNYYDRGGVERGVLNFNRARHPAASNADQLTDVDFTIWLTEEQKTELSTGEDGWKFRIMYGSTDFSGATAGVSFAGRSAERVDPATQATSARLHGDQYFIREISRDAVVNEGGGETGEATSGDSGFSTISEINELVPGIPFTQSTQGLPNNAANDPLLLPVTLSAPQAGDILNVTFDFEGDGIGTGQFYINRLRNNAVHNINSDLNAIAVSTDISVPISLGTDLAELQTDGSYLWSFVIGSHTDGATITTPSISITGSIQRALSTGATPNAYRPRMTQELYFPYRNTVDIGRPLPLQFPGNLDDEESIVLTLEALQSESQGTNFPAWFITIPAELLKGYVAQPSDLVSGLLPVNGSLDYNFTHDRHFIGEGNNSNIIGGFRFYNASGEENAYTHIVVTRNVRYSPFTRPVIRSIGAY